MTVTERLYKRLYEIKNAGADPEAIYIGNALMNELHEICRTFRSDLIYGDKPTEWCGLPVFEVVGHPDHLFIAQKPYEYSGEKK